MSTLTQKMVAEGIGTFTLVLGGCGTAIFAGGSVGFLGVAIAFGLTVVAMAYGIGHISGAHLNPAVSFGCFVNGRMSGKEFGSYVAAQIVQIIISVIPGQELQIVAGFMYGIPLAFLLSIIGAAIGTLIAFYLARWLGQDAVRMLFGDEKTDEYMRRLNSRRAITITFLIYLIPGLPKDIMSYIAIPNQKLPYKL